MKKKLLFVHIPKCGGTTFKATLHQIFGKDKVFKIWNSPNADASVTEFADMDIDQILTYPCIAGHLPYMKAKEKLGDNIKQYFVCTLVRNPIDHVLSSWNYINTNSKHSAHHRISQMSFEDFIENETNNQQCLFICGKPNSKYAAEILNNEYSLVEPLERFNSFIKRISHEFNYSVRDYKIINKSKKIISKSSLDEKKINLIKQNNLEDLLLYQKVISLKKTNIND